MDDTHHVALPVKFRAAALRVSPDRLRPRAVAAGPHV